jgi:transcription elongation factor Elf1
MQCPKCEEGNINKIFFKKTDQRGFLCDLCGAAWQGSEGISDVSGCTIQSVTKDGEMEYTFVDADEKDESAKSVMYPKFK